MKGDCALKSIQIKNLRSLKDTGQINLPAISLLVGVNSSGKSTFLRTFPLIKQSINKKTDGPLLWAGDVDDYVDFGSFDETITNDGSDAIEFRFSFTLDVNLDELPLKFFMPDKNSSHKIDYLIKIKKLRSSEFVSNVSISIDGKKVEIDYINNHFIIDSTSMHFSLLDLDVKNHRIVGIAVPYLLNSIFGYNLPALSLLLETQKLSDADNTQELLDGIIEQTGYILIGKYLFDDVPFSQLNKTFIRDFSHTISNDAITDIISNVIKDGISKYKVLSEEDRSRFKLKYMLYYFYFLFPQIDGYLKTYFSQVHYIAPLRATAERYYRLRNLAVDEIDYQGKNLPIFLNSLAAYQLTDFQKWTTKYFGFKTSVKKDTGHLSIKIELKNSNNAINISDTGFGYSQILPIITQLWFLSSQNKNKGKTNIPLVIAIEQPELHLHPALQAKLAKVFIASVRLARGNGFCLQLLIETHSETIVNYFGQAIASNQISPDEITLVMFDKNMDKNTTSVRINNYDEDGFIKNWPIGFFQPESEWF